MWYLCKYHLPIQWWPNFSVERILNIALADRTLQTFSPLPAKLPPSYLALTLENSHWNRTSHYSFHKPGFHSSRYELGHCTGWPASTTPWDGGPRSWRDPTGRTTSAWYPDAEAVKKKINFIPKQKKPTMTEKKHEQSLPLLLFRRTRWKNSQKSCLQSTTVQHVRFHYEFLAPSITFHKKTIQCSRVRKMQ